MKNRIQITTDNKQVHATIEVNASKTGTAILAVFILLEVVIFSMLLSEAPLEELLYKSIPILLIALFLIGFPIKYLLWNLYGQEKLIISKQTIQWQYHYGLFSGEQREADYILLTTAYERIREINGEEVGRLLFYSANTETEVSKMIHRTSALITKQEADLLNAKIWSVLSTEHRVLE